MAATVWKGYLSFGLVSMPVKLVRAARAGRVSLHQLRRAGAPEPERARGHVIELPVPQLAEREDDEESVPAWQPRREPPREAAAPVPAQVERVRQTVVSGRTEEPVAPGELVKGYEYQPEQWVLIDKEDIRRIAPKTSKTMQINEFVRLSEIDPIYFESSYYLLPERAGEKAYAILYQALRETGFAAVAEVAMHNREHVVILHPGRSGLVAHTMFYEDEIRRDDEYRADSKLAAGRELELAKKLVESLAGPFAPEKYRDSYRDRLEGLIADKVQGREVAREQEPEPAKQPALDLIEALQRSLETARKPAASAPRPGGAKKKRAGRHTDRS